MPDTLSIVAIGSGNLASHIVPALHSIGCTINQVFSRDLSHANGLAHQVDAQGIDNLKDIRQDAGLYLLMVSDDAIETVVNSLPELPQSAILAHSSGAQSIELLCGYCAHYGSFYPLQTFRKGQLSQIDKVPFLINGNTEWCSRQLRMLARKLSRHVSECNDEDRLRYHLSAVLMNNFTNHLACLAQDFLRSNALDPDYLDPIAETTLQKIIDHNACDTQTGPAIRRDHKLMQKHLGLLKSNQALAHIYKTLSESIIQESKKEDNADSG